MKIEIKGDIIPNKDKWVYEWLEYDSTCPRDVLSAMEKANGEPLEVYINSGGGDVFSGSEIYEALRTYEGEVRIHIVGHAASAATLPACAGFCDITPTGLVMVHNVASAARGDYHAMDQSSEVLQKANRAIAAAYVLKTGKTEAEILELMDRETWMTAQEAVSCGLVDAISQSSNRFVAHAPGTVPPEVIQKIKNTIKNPFTNRKCQKAQAVLTFLKNKRSDFKMKREKYLNERQVLLDAAQMLIDEGEMEQFDAKVKEINDLDNKYETEAKAEANLRALCDNPFVTDIAEHSVPARGKTVERMDSVEVGEDLYNTMEYRKAFMNHVMKGDSVPVKFINADANTKTTDVSVVIPTTVMERIVEKMEATGMILPLVTRTAYKGGVKIPVSTVKPVATWVAEGAGSDRQKRTVGSIDFAYNKLRCEISVSLETDTMALPVFETVFVNNVSEAMVKAQEQAIVSGTGSGQPKGFLTETPAEGQAIELGATDQLEYQTLVDAEAALPLAYENDAVWFMTKKTFMGFVGMVDANEQPIARVNAGINGRPERTLLGRTVVLNDYMSSYADTMTADAIIAALFNPKDYILNTNLAVTIKRYEDNDTDDQVTKAVMLVDGKVVDVNSLVTITKKKPAA